MMKPTITFTHRSDYVSYAQDLMSKYNTQAPKIFNLMTEEELINAYHAEIQLGASRKEYVVLIQKALLRFTPVGAILYHDKKRSS